MEKSHTNTDTAKRRNRTPRAEEWVVWQLVDSAFPTGGFAHSGGLETAWQWGELDDPHKIDAFVTSSLWQTGKGALPFVMAVHRDPADFAYVDRRCEAFISNHVANRASRGQGQALLASAEMTFCSETLAGLRHAVKIQRWPCHLAPVFGAVTRAVNASSDQSAKLFLFLALRGLISSAVRLGAVGGLEGQALQHRLMPCAQRIVDRCVGLPLQDAAQVAPHIDVLQGSHDRLYSRLFQS